MSIHRTKRSVYIWYPVLAVLRVLMIAGLMTVPAAGFAKIETIAADGTVQSVPGSDYSLRRADITTISGDKNLTLTGSKWVMLQGRKTQLYISAEPSESVRTVAYSSSNRKIADVSSTGKVTARAKGTAKITALITGKDGKTIRKTLKIEVIARTWKNNKDIKDITKWKSVVSQIGRSYHDKPQNCIIFYGNSSIHRWVTLRKDMAGMSVLNHGFGGSTVNDCLYYAEKLIIPFNPAAVVFYAGTNDIGRGYSVREVYTRTKEYFEYMHCRLPGTRIYYISMPLQPKRIRYWPSIKALNRKIREYCKKDPRVTFINASAALNKGNMSKRAGYFLEDGIHLTEKGYKVWTEAVRPVLLNDGYTE